MPILRAPNGKKYDTKDVPSRFDPFFCSKCGERMGWSEDDNQGLGQGRVVCEDCIADMQDD